MFRRVRRTNDARGWILVVALPAAVAVGAAGTAFGVAAGAWWQMAAPFALLTTLPAAALAVAVRDVLRPREVEFVVGDGVIRWGRADRPARQQRVPLADVRRLVVNDRDGEVFADAGGSGLRRLGLDALARREDVRALVAFLREHHPELPVVDWLTGAS